MTSTLAQMHQNIYIAPTLIAMSFVLLVLSLILHFYQHFKCQSCCAPATRLRCFCNSVDGQTFDFFPITFLLYLLFWMLVCIILVMRMVLINGNETWNLSWSQFDISTIDHNISVTTDLIIFVMDCIVIYAIMLMSLMESLFTFYRFYTTLLTTKHLKLTTLTDVIQKYTIYILIFATLYAITIHVYFWVFPAVVLLHLTFGIYCNWKFASLIIMSYTDFLGLKGRTSNSDEEVLHSVYFMRKVSSVCTGIQSLYLCLFMVGYCIHINLIIIYLPVLWSIASFMFALNFVRNRLCVQHMIQPLMHCCNRHKQGIVRSQMQRIPQNTPVASPDGAKNSFAPYPDPDAIKVTHPVNAPALDEKHTETTDTHVEKIEKFVPDEIMVELDLERDANHASQYTPPGKRAPVTPTTPDQAFSFHPQTHSMTFHYQKGMFAPNALDDKQASKSLTKPRPKFKDCTSLTAKDGVYEASILTETDIDGRKQEEFNRNIANGSTSHCDAPAVYPSPKIVPSIRFPQLANIDIGVLHEDEPMEDKKEETQVHKLDVQQVMLQLSLLRKFGFDVKQFESKLKKALSTSASYVE